MAESAPNPDVFDVRKIRRLVELMKEHELTEMDLRQENMRIQLRRGPKGEAVETIVRQSPVPAPAPAQPAAASTAPVADENQADDRNLGVITSPIVGTFYASPDPSAPPYIKVGDHVGPETTVCIVEAMKVFNEIPAELSGKIVAVLAKSGEPVEYGQALFKVDTAG